MKAKEVQQTQNTQLNGPIPERIKIFEDMTLITHEIADLLIFYYFTRIHPGCAVVNKIEFLEQYYFHNSSPPDKYLTYSIAFLGSMIASADDFEGRITSKELMTIRKHLKDKAYQIIGISYKRPLVSTIQALLVLSVYVEDEVENEDEDMSHWFISGMAIRLAQDMGLHLDCSNWKIPSYEIELRRRLWYSCYFIDRWGSAQLGRPMTINDDEFDVKLPSPYELGTNVPRTLAQTIPPLLLQAYTALEQKIPIYHGCSSFIGITKLLGQVLIALYSAKARQQRSKELIYSLEHSLNLWKQSIVTEMISKSEIHEDLPLINISYFTLLIFIYRPFINADTEDPEFVFKALGICTSAAHHILNFAEMETKRTFINAPWSPITYSIFQAAIIFLHNAKGENELLKRQGQEALNRCIRLYIYGPDACLTRTAKVLLAVASAYRVSFEAINCSLSFKCTPSPSLDTIQPVIITRETLPSKETQEIVHQYHPIHTKIATMTNSLCLNSTRPEDMFNFSLNSAGFLKGSLDVYNNQTEPIQQQQHQQQQQQQQQQWDSSNVDFHSELFTINNENFLQDFNLSSLKSDVPLWDVPSGVTWNEWEEFMKHSG
ncbi:hypothetical protein RO3G_15986 [Rhizopus delemar RA 99-880]|uniref:Xylanolytic transcriptional activator regulatory domain-containing protein n=3 Tax=Rhizopus TaxID=4842 RepID=I1CS45_RHIO9|nr:hypothetical protein RO3G_15986 [Rhizopus delemar RA 99-880]|eukprot:EIE91275.1 hypothetical protein RO3G_15986 [Rhizopus delemar RA 99-880]